MSWTPLLSGWLVGDGAVPCEAAMVSDGAVLAPPADAPTSAALLPVIAEVSRNGKVRPERPLSISVIAGFQGVIASPISAATVAMLGFLLV